MLKKTSKLTKVVVFGFSLIALSILNINSVIADDIQEGEKLLTPCLELSNAQEYPEYEFYLYADGVNPEMRYIDSGECVSWYKFNTDIYVVAVKSDKVKQDVMSDYKNYVEQEYTSYLLELPGTIQSESLKVSKHESVSENSTKQDPVDTFMIDSLNDSTFALEMVSSDDSNSTPEILPQEPIDFIKIIIPLGVIAIIGIVGFVIVLLLKKKKK